MGMVLNEPQHLMPNVVLMMHGEIVSLHFEDGSREGLLFAMLPNNVLWKVLKETVQFIILKSSSNENDL